jgi:hypothetical protein
LAQPVQPSGSAKLPNDTFVTANQKENNSIYDYNAQSIDPISSIKQAYRDSLFSSTKTEVNERLAEVMAVDMTIKKPSDLNYFGEASVSVEYGDRDWVSVICRVMDLHSGVPDPEQTLVQGTTTQTFTDITRLRSSVGKFYAPMDDLRGKGASNIEVGDWLIVEFQDKTTLSNGIIKDVYFKKDKSTWSAGGGSLGAPSAFDGAYPMMSNAPANLDNPPANQEFWTLLAICYAEGGANDQGMADVAQSIYNRYYLANKYGGYSKSIAKNVSTARNYEPTFKNQGDWQRITDEASAIRALKGYRPSYNVSTLQQGLQKALEALRNAEFQASAANWVRLRPDFLAGAPDQKVGGIYQVERSEGGYGKHNNFHIRSDNTLRRYIVTNGAVNPAADIPEIIRPFIEGEILPVSEPQETSEPTEFPTSQTDPLEEPPVSPV